MTINLNRIRQHIQAFRFEDLFIDELGWDQCRDRIEVLVEDRRVFLNAFAEKRGMVAFEIAEIPEYKLRRKIEQQVAKTHRENIIIYTDAQQTQQIWQWVRRETGKPLANRERPFYRGQSGENIAQVLAGIAFSLDEEDNLTIVDVTSRVRAAFDVERVTRRFYDRFKRQHDAFLAFIEGIPDEDFQRWYASVMLNRLMFIYFVQKKGFLDGDVDYLRNRLAQIEGNFYRDFLCLLFFEGFAKKDHPAAVRRLLGDVPYLNGGLFLQHQLEELYGDAIQIENEAFEKLFDFFDDYRWHLDERPLRDDDEINPDVLGYIFEKYINQKQMGAYYTKEDITEYISKNTVIPFLFDEARKAVKIAFEGDHTLWDLLTENPDRYIYPAVRHGAEYELPENIAAGLDDVSQRGDWNTPAPSEYALPTEIWREVVARRKRYADVRGKLERGEVRQINDLITLNLDIQQFAQDVIDYTDSADVVRAFWKAINHVTVLDPTCGSGAFLFAALNILEPLYEACLERMEGFVAELERTGGGHPQRYSDFREVLGRIEQHPNRRYFILKSIIVNNLFGVDIMEEAVEICKLRLFLKLVAQVDDKGKIEPLPDIDFNIRAGNTLVGFATQNEVKRAMTTTSGGQGKLVFGEDQAALAEIERKADDVDRLFGLFRQQQTELGGEVRPEDKQALRDKLRDLEDELNRLLAGQYGVDAGNDGQYAKWLKSHEPFHWFVEFYGVLKSGGFDVIIGNPPWVEYHTVRKTYRIIEFSTEACGNLYAYVIERCTNILRKMGRMGMIVQLSAICTDRMQPLQDLYFARSRHIWASAFDDRPAKLFDGLEHIRATIILNEKNTDIPTTERRVFTTNLNRWYSETRGTLFQVVCYGLVSELLLPGSFPKISDERLFKIVKKLREFSSTFEQVYDRNAKAVVHYHRSPLYWIRAQDFMPHFASENAQRSVHHFKDFGLIDKAYTAALGSVINSTVFYMWFIAFGNGRNVAIRDIVTLPAPPSMLDKSIISEFDKPFKNLMDDYVANSIIRKRRDGVEYQEFYPSHSKPIIDEIDRMLAQHYGFTDEELDFIINYDIKYRMGDDLGGEEDEGEE